MNGTQVASTFAPIITFFAGLLAGKGVFGLDAATWAQALGAIAGFAGTVWAIFKSTKTQQISAVAQMPEVQSIKLEPEAPQATLAATPTNVTK